MNSSNRSNNRSVSPDPNLIVALRHSIGWTQEEAARNSNFSERLIRKLEQGGQVRPKTLHDVLVCYHNELGNCDWDISDFLVDENKQEDPPSRNPSAEQLIVDYFDVVFNQRQPERIHEFIAPDIKFNGEGRTEIGREVIEKRANTLLNAFSPIEHQMLESNSHCERVFCRWSVRQRHVGDFFGIPPTKLWVEACGQSTVTVVDGMIVEVHDQWDLDHVIRQLRGDDPIVI